MHGFGVFIAFSLYLLPLVTAQRGAFATFGISVGDQIVSKDSNLFIGENGENTDADDALEPRSVIWNLTRPIPLFGKTVNRLRVRKYIIFHSSPVFVVGTCFSANPQILPFSST